MLRYAITDRKLLAGDGDAVSALAAQAGKWAAAGVDWVQLREKDLPAGKLEEIALAMVKEIKKSGGKTGLLVNGRVDVAIAVGAAGVHLTASAGELTVAQVRELWPEAVVSVSCHTVEEVVRAREAGADVVLFGAVFEKAMADGSALPGVGLERLREACKAAATGSTPIKPMLALGGVTEANTAECMAAGAAGVAGIRLFLI